MAAAAHGVFHGHDGGIAFLDEDTIVKIQGIGIDRRGQRGAFRVEVIETLFDADTALFEGFEFLVHAGLRACQFGLRLFQLRLGNFERFHLLQFAIFQLGHIGLVAFDFMAEGGEFVVLARFELLVVQALDGGLARLDIELDVFDLHLDFLHRQIGGFHGGLISRELHFGPGLHGGDVLEVFLQRTNALVTFLKLNEFRDVL